MADSLLTDFHLLSCVKNHMFMLNTISKCSITYHILFTSSSIRRHFLVAYSITLSVSTCSSRLIPEWCNQLLTPVRTPTYVTPLSNEALKNTYSSSHNDCNVLIHLLKLPCTCHHTLALASWLRIVLVSSLVSASDNMPTDYQHALLFGRVNMFSWVFSLAPGDLSCRA